MWVEYYPPVGEGLLNFIESGDPPLTFAYEPPYIIESFDGLDDNRATPVTVRGPAQRGSTLRDAVVNERTVSLGVMVLAEPSGVLALETLKAALRRALVVEPGTFGTPPRLGLLRFYRDDPALAVLEVEALPRESPQFTAGDRLSWARADIEFLVPYPFPRETTDRVFNVAGLGGFTFPVEMPAAGWGMPSFNISVDINNGGDVRAPIMAAIYGDVTDPTLWNDTTGERIKWIGNIPAGSRLEVNTEFGRISAEMVTAAGVRTNAMGSIDHSVTTFWALRAGGNTVRFGAAVNTSGYANVYWRQRFGGS